MNVLLKSRPSAASKPSIESNLLSQDLEKSIGDATSLLKALSHEGRLLILCHLASGEKSVTELEELLSIRQAAVSQQLSRLRLEGLVHPRREGKVIYYSLHDERPQKIIELLCEMFHKPS